MKISVSVWLSSVNLFPVKTRQANPTLLAVGGQPDRVTG